MNLPFKNKTKMYDKLKKGLKEKVYLYTLIDRYYCSHNKVLKPKNKGNYVGIEVECFSLLDKHEVMALVLDCDLEKYINIASDGSIESPGRHEGHELRILIPEKQVPQVMKKFIPFFRRGKFRVNDSCGLHVHLDMRNRKVEACYAKLVKLQDMLYGLVKKHRWSSSYCSYSDANRNRSDRFTAINRTAYGKHRTLEVRLHHGSVDASEIENWVNLLLKAINSAAPKDLSSKKELVSWSSDNKKVQDYIKSKFNTDWIKEKTRKEKEHREQQARRSALEIERQDYLRSIGRIA